MCKRHEQRKAHAKLFADLDDTLWCATSVLMTASRRFHAHIEEHHPRIHERFPEQQFSAVMKALRKSRTDIAHDFTLLRKAALRDCALDAGVPADNLPLVVDTCYEVFREARNQVKLATFSSRKV